MWRMLPTIIYSAIGNKISNSVTGKKVLMTK